MSSSTIATLLRDHQQNDLLNQSAPPVMPLSAGDFSADEGAAPLDERILEAAMQALNSGQTHYVDVPGIAPLRESVAAYLNGLTGGQFQKGNIVITAGMQEARFLALQMISEQFSTVAVPTVVHPGALRALGVRPRKLQRVPVTGTYHALPSAADVSGALSAGATLFYLESPSRLTGEAYTAAELAQIAELVAQHNAALIVDEGLAAWAEDAPSFAGQSALKERLALLGEVYPGMGLASWFIGFIAAPESWVPLMQSQKQIMAICTSTATQYAALEAGKLYGEAHLAQLARLKANRARFVERAAALGLRCVLGAALNMVAVALPQGVEALKPGVQVAAGADFGLPSFVRVDVSSGVSPD
ncbi:MAG: aminotransferase class I/II-fold pyridoxal phosphate-dependent enzyme, partial [Aggregatilineales bacterium]